MGRSHRLLAFGTGLIACCLIVVGSLVSRHHANLTLDEQLINRAESVTLALDTHRTLAPQRLVEARSLQHLVLLAFGLVVCGGLVAIVVAARDHERLKRAQEHVDEEHARRDRFLASVSHELRTPLNAIVGWIQVIKAGLLKPAEAQHAIDVIERNTRTEARLVADLLDASRLSQGHLVVSRQPVDLVALLEAAVAVAQPVADAKDVALNRTADRDEVVVVGDWVRLHQVFAGLLSNALKFTSPAGHVSADVSVLAGFAQLTVSDDGEGIPSDLLPQVFDTFVQGQTVTKRVGLGLGLSIVKDLVELHGGSVAVASAGPGRGATFTVRLPLITPAVR